MARVGLRTLVATSSRPQVTVGLDDEVYVGWTRRDRSRSSVTALLERLR